MKNIEQTFRQIHLDFHTGPAVEGVGKDFNAQEFAKTLKKSKVTAINVFGRCHHGLLYYNSKKFPERIHPHLVNKNLMGEMIDACHKQGIKAPVYLTIGPDKYTAEHYPEWLYRGLDGRHTGGSIIEPGFGQMPCINTGYRDFLKEMISEICEDFNVDGFWLDLLFDIDCSCSTCRKKMKEEGYLLHKADDRMEYAKKKVIEFKQEISNHIASHGEDISVFYNCSHVGPYIKKSIESYSHIELESIPSGNWGYITFPVSMRYARTLGKDCLAHTGKFHIEWGDLHSFKNYHALEYECYRMLALCCKCLIGDQLDPGGVLNEYAYDMVEKVYTRVEQLEPWCVNAKPRNDFAVMTAEEFVGGGRGKLPPANMGAEHMFSALGYQYDFVDSEGDFDAYKLLILPDNIPVNDTLHKKLQRYLNNGGKIIATYESGLNEDKSAMTFAETGVTLVEPTYRLDGTLARGVLSPSNEYVDYIVPVGDIGSTLPETEHVMYIKGLEVAADSANTLVYFTKPRFDRTYEHFSSHRQSPSSGEFGNPAVVKSGNVIYFASPIFTTYNARAPKWCRTMLKNAIDMLIGEQILTHNGPSTAFLTVNHQESENRDVVHLLHYVPEQRCSEILTIDDIIPLHDLSVNLLADKAPISVKTVLQQKDIPFTYENGKINFIIDKLNGYEVVEVKY